MAPRKKRKTSGGSLTGGTGDVKPQFLTATTPVGAGTNDYSVISIQVPRIILSSQDNATIMEILRVDYYLGIEDLADSDAVTFGFLSPNLRRLQDETSTFTSMREDVQDPLVFAFVVQNQNVTVQGGSSNVMPLSYDCTDSNGNGILMASDRFFFVTGAIAASSVIDSTVKILYRMVNVDIIEYVGIVQSQLG